MKNIIIIIILADNFEEIEVVTPLDIWRRAGFTVTLASISNELQACGQQGLIISADRLLQNLSGQDFDVLYLPGGMGHKLIQQSPLAMNWINDFITQKKHIFAICAASTILAPWLNDKKATSYPDLKDQIPHWVNKKIVHDDIFITSQGAGTAHDLAFYGVSLLQDPKSSLILQEKTLFSQNQELPQG